MMKGNNYCENSDKYIGRKSNGNNATSSRWSGDMAYSIPNIGHRSPKWRAKMNQITIPYMSELQYPNTTIIEAAKKWNGRKFSHCKADKVKPRPPKEEREKRKK